MEVYDLPGISCPKELYELATINYGIHASSMDKLVRFAADIQRRTIEHFVSSNGPAIEIRVLGETDDGNQD